MVPKVKICGITSVEDALAAVASGADAIGLVFYPPSKRYIKPADAAEIVAAVGPFVTTVGLFVNSTQAEVERALQVSKVQLIQFHGDEDADFCCQFGRPYIKAIRMAPELNPVQEIARHPQASGYLFDAWQDGEYGGTGKTFDWQRIENMAGGNLILAGGLKPCNVQRAVDIVEPYGVDVSGGVEQSPGQKDQQLVKDFIVQAKQRNPA